MGPFGGCGFEGCFPCIARSIAGASEVRRSHRQHRVGAGFGGHEEARGVRGGQRRLDHAQEGIRVNCICPAIVETDLVQMILSQAPDREAAVRLRTAQIPLGRMGKPEDVAAMAVFLASEESSWLTGAAIALDGGLTAY